METLVYCYKISRQITANQMSDRDKRARLYSPDVAVIFIQMLESRQ